MSSTEYKLSESLFEKLNYKVTKPNISKFWLLVDFMNEPWMPHNKLL